MSTAKIIERLTNRVVELEKALDQIVNGVILDESINHDNGLRMLADRSWRDSSDNYVANELTKLNEIAREALYASAAEEEVEEEPYPTRRQILDTARKLDPYCWLLYSGMTKQYKQYMERRRQDSIAMAEKKLRNEQ